MRILVLLFVMMMTFSDAAAQNKRDKFRPARFQAEMEQYITKKAGLTPKEAAKFFPFYSEMQKKQRILHKELKSLKRIKPVTDDECKKNIEKRDELSIEIKEIQRDYHEKFMRILSPKKVYDVLKAEDMFHRQMFKRTANNARKKK